MPSTQYSLWARRDRESFAALESLHANEDEALNAADALLSEGVEDGSDLINVMLKKPDGTTLNTWSLVD